ncbi:hypothetical protein AKJ49_00545 [candidate division MSBL1 archaeon SCGC-AAA382A03]|uniref:Uncharacterized protein n=1 Tax=candidate division MSBL1 archaeon SCGC-AAA382A03 TaxID=1698278 RepID=A0A133VGI7_9EURY|nr:hypothetical protein AKJ49_00545 [candidate division MSBL1 archaeon SCGC-AAA382A03]
MFGFKSKTTRENKNGQEKVYENFYPGVLAPLPHLRLGKSVIAVPKSARDKLDNFFQDSKWGSIDLYSFDGILPRKDRMKAMKETLERIKIDPNHSLKEEIEFLKSMKEEGELDSRQVQKAKRVVKRCEDLMKHDWSDEKEFSKQLKNKIIFLQKIIS